MPFPRPGIRVPSFSCAFLALLLSAGGAQALPILVGESLGGFSVEFELLPSASTPSSQFFDIYDPVSFATLYPGVTTSSAGGTDAVEIVYALDTAPSGNGRYNYTVINNAFAGGIEAFTIFFDVFTFAALVEGSEQAPAGFDDVLLIQPDPDLPDDGFYDALDSGPVAVAEPGATGLLAIGLFGLIALRRRERRGGTAPG